MTEFETIDLQNDGEYVTLSVVLLSARCRLQVKRERCYVSEPQTVVVEIVHDGKGTQAYRMSARKALELAEALARQALGVHAEVPFEWGPWEKQI